MNGETDRGTPQGAGISPLLANIFLHYALDLWVHQWRGRHARGRVTIVRYADDFVMGCETVADAQRMVIDLKDRLAGLRGHRLSGRGRERHRHRLGRKPAGSAPCNVVPGFPRQGVESRRSGLGLSIADTTELNGTERYGSVMRVKI